jgi:lambda repressor-like predicted transcriptional regulator
MRPEQIKAQLEARGTSIADIAREADIAAQNISATIRWRKYPRIEQLVAEALDKPLHVVFPDRYQPPADWVEPEMTEIPTAELRQIRESLVIAAQTIERLCAA